MGHRKFDLLNPSPEFQIQPRAEGGFYALASHRDPIVIESNIREEAFVLAGAWYYDVPSPYTQTLDEIRL